MRNPLKNNTSKKKNQTIYSPGSEIENSNGRKKGKNLLEFPDDYTVVDIETTGLSPLNDSIIEIAAIRVRNGECVEKFESLIKPVDKFEYDDDDEVDFIIAGNGLKYYYIDSFISQLTGITNKMLDQAPMIDIVLPDFQKFIGKDIVLGHNVNFDINFLYDSFINILGVPFDNNFVDTMCISRAFLNKLRHHRLIDISRYYSIEQDKFHRAENDCFVTYQCYVKLKQDILEKHRTILSF